MSEQKPNVILLVPTYNGNRNWELFSEWIYRLDPKPRYTIFLENNSTDGTLENLANFKLPHEIIRIWMREDLGKALVDSKWEYTAIAHIRQLLLTRVKKLNPDYAIFMDDDTLPPHDMIAKFIATGKDIVGGCYYRIFPEGMFLATKFTHPNEVDRKANRYLLANLEFIKVALPHDGYYKEHGLLHGELVEVPMTSGGCLCLSRRAIIHPQLYFYPNPAKPFYEFPASEDFGYCMRARRMGIRTYLHTGIVCRHLIDIRDVRAWAVDSRTREPVPFKWGHQYP